MISMGFWSSKTKNQKAFDKALKKSETWQKQSSRIIKDATKGKKKKKSGWW
jgi:hypothetical protein